mgnify:CR=1 FL=1|jgi:SOS-response transcriptional repressor LexA
MTDLSTKKILKHILTVVEETGATPSIRDIQTVMGFGSTNAVRHHLKKLAEEGHLSEQGGRIALGPRYAVTVHDMATQ